MEKFSSNLLALLRRHGFDPTAVDQISDHAWEVFFADGTRLRLSLGDGKLWLQSSSGHSEVLELESAVFAFQEARTQDPTVALSPATGKVHGLSVSAGDPVSAGQVLLKIESMKMEIEVRAQATMVVSEVLTSLGAHVSYNQVLVRLKEAGRGA